MDEVEDSIVAGICDGDRLGKDSRTDVTIVRILLMAWRWEDLGRGGGSSVGRACDSWPESRGFDPRFRRPITTGWVGVSIM